MSAAPLVSVCVPARDAAAHVRGAVATALRQDVELEVLVHDDASGDGTAAAVREIGDPRVRVLSHASPLGVAENRNSLVASARGRFVSWLDADDELEPGALARHAGILEADSGVGLVHGAFEVMDERGEPLPRWPAPHPGDVAEDGPVAFRHLLAANEITTSTTMARRDLLVRAGPFVAVGPSSSDWDMWLRLAMQGGVAYCATPAARYRQHAGTISRQTTLRGDRLRSDARVVARILSLPGVPEQLANRRRGRAALAAKALLHAGDAYTAGHRASALRSLALAGRMGAGRVARGLARAVVRNDDFASHTLTKEGMRTLAARLEGTRFGTRLAALGARDPAWEDALARVAAGVRASTPHDAVLATVTKWDPTILRLSGRQGMQFPDRRRAPDGYPRNGEAALAELRAARAGGVTHVVLTSGTEWWLDHYPELGAALRERSCLVWRGEDGMVFELGAAA